MIKGYPDNSRENRTSVDPATVNHIDPYRDGLDVRAQIAYYAVANDTVQAGSTQSLILTTSGNTYLKGDVIRFLTGTLATQTAVIDDATLNHISLSQRLTETANGTFSVYRPTLLELDSNGRLYVRNTEYGVSGLSNFYWNIGGFVEIPTTVIGDPTTGIPWSVDSVSGGGCARVHGSTAHDAVDAGNPLKMGGKASSATPVAVASGDRVEAYFDTTGHQHVKVDDLPIGTITAASASSATTVFQITVGSDRFISIHTTGTFTATQTFQVSNDGTNWISFPLQNATAPNTAFSATGATGTIYSGFLPTGFFRSQITAYTSGTVNVRYILSKIPQGYAPPTTVTVSGTVTASSCTGNVAHDAADSGNPVKVGVKSRTAHVTAVANNDRSDWTGDVLGQAKVSLAHNTRTDTFTTAVAGTAIGDGFQTFSFFSLTVQPTGAVTSWSVDLQYSLDNVTWTTFLTHTNVTGAGVPVFSADAIPRPVFYLRANTTAIVLGAGTNVISRILGVQ